MTAEEISLRLQLIQSKVCRRIQHTALQRVLNRLGSPPAKMPHNQFCLAGSPLTVIKFRETQEESKELFSSGFKINIEPVALVRCEFDFKIWA